jgi:hypothetical protein
MSVYSMASRSMFCVAMNKVVEFYRELEFGKKNESTVNVLKLLFSK